jgi:predicted ATPase
MIDKIIFHNFKTFADRSLELRPLTLLSGLNGTGKSTVLQGLALLRQSYDAGFLIKGQWLLNGELLELGTGRDVGFVDASDDLISITIYGTDESTGLRTSVTEISVVDRKRDSDVLWERGSARKEPSKWSLLSLFRPGFQYLRADRISPAVTFPRSQHAVLDRKFLGSRGEFVPHYLLEYGAEEIPCPSLIRDMPTYAGKLLSQVNAWLQEFSPGVRVDIKGIEMTDFVRLDFSYRTTGIAYTESFRATNVGFGLTHALPVVVACLASPPGCLVLIENPEAQLHPQGQVVLGRLFAGLAAAGVQVIIETHSDHILNGLRIAIRKGVLAPENACFHFFDRDEHGGTVVKSPKVSREGLLSEWPSGFFTQWDESLLELLQ